MSVSTIELLPVAVQETKVFRFGECLPPFRLALKDRYGKPVEFPDDIFATIETGQNANAVDSETASQFIKAKVSCFTRCLFSQLMLMLISFLDFLIGTQWGISLQLFLLDGSACSGRNYSR